MIFQLIATLVPAFLCVNGIVDFKNVEFQDPFEKRCEFSVWQNAFNSSPEMGSFFAMIKEKYSIDVAIETGTYEAKTTKFFSLLFDEVHTIEVNHAFYQNALRDLHSFANVQCHLGSSETVLAQILPSLIDRPVLFYLDAHWYSYWPLKDELEIISRTHRDNCIVVIDDMKVPGRPDVFFDRNGSEECCFEYVKEKLDKIFTEYDYYFLVPSEPLHAGKLLVVPKSWNFTF